VEKCAHKVGNGKKKREIGERDLIPEGEKGSAPPQPGPMEKRGGRKKGIFFLWIKGRRPRSTQRMGDI